MESEMNPSTEWREQIADDETQRFDGLAAVLSGLQKARAANHPMGRALHYKPDGGWTSRVIGGRRTCA